ncbi:PAS domain S-box-containing protein [Rhizobium sp. BK529]|uniref:PAS domain-containing protein n=1 Tax=Rhizobium sp. BK529 TaxID=2586983 RepID=UPI00180261E1|nr:PAS domain-containing protein [Rhizobium sp. BK529]MBB3590564.1 PAS domain S-box-containing protein [Rhizobium sp. BK529]
MLMADLSHRRLGLAVTACLVGLAVSWLTLSPLGLIGPVVAAFLYARGRVVRPVYVMLAAGLGGALLAAVLDAGMREAALAWAAFCALSLSLGPIFSGRMAERLDADAVRAAKSVERLTGIAWATDAAGAFLYVTPSVLAFLGLTLEDFNAPLANKEFGWKRAIHPDDYEVAAALWRRCLQTGEHYSVDSRMLRPTGGYGWTRSTGQPLRDGNGVITGWYGTVIDTEIAPPRNELAADDPGVSAADMTASDTLPPMAEVHPHDRATVEQARARAFFHGIPQVSSFRKLQPDGSYQWVEFRVEPKYGTSVAVDPAVARQDERWTTASELGETGEAVRAALAIENLYGGAWAMDASGQFTYATPTAQTSIAMALEDLNLLLDGKPFIEGGRQGWQRGVHPDDSEEAAATLRHALKTGEHWNFEYRVLRANGAYVWHRAAARPTRDGQGRITGWYGVTVDIDAYKRTEAALRERERQLQQLIDTVPALIWSTSADGRPIYVNKPFIEVTGATLEEMIGPDGLPSLSVIHPDDREAARRAIRHSFTTGEPYSQRYRQARADGSYRWTDTRAQPLRDEAGTILRWYGVSTDIHDMVTTQEALSESERFLRQLVETLPAMIDCADPKGEPIFRSQRLREFLGYDLEALDGSGKSRLAGTLDAGIHPDEVADVKERYAHALATGEPYARRHRLRRFDGEYRWVETRAAPMRDAEGAIVQWNVVCLDIDGEVRAQEKLLAAQESLARASQAASLAELSASIAHEVNQPLSAILSSSDACRRWLMTEPPNLERAQKTLERIIISANSASDVVKRVRALFKRAEDKRDCVTLGRVIVETGDLLAEEAARRGIRFDIDSDDIVLQVPFDRVQIQQVLINLMRNGMDAMEAVAGDKLLGVRVRKADGMMRIEVSDRGAGIEFPDKIFEPFFSTKEQGMGMGLAICRSIVEAHGGQLWAETNEPRGTTFIFTLPAEAEA